MKFVIDMNTTRQWIAPLRQIGHEAIHWSRIGADAASDLDIMRWARDTDHVVFTEDLDFGAELSRSGAGGPSVVQLRIEANLPRYAAPRVLAAIQDSEDMLSKGALLVVSYRRSRIRPLPLSRSR